MVPFIRYKRIVYDNDHPIRDFASLIKVRFLLIRSTPTPTTAEEALLLMIFIYQTVTHKKMYIR